MSAAMPSVSMGFPDNDSFTFSADRYNIEGAGFADETAAITMQLSDRFNNPVPDGTVVSFTTEGGSIVTVHRPPVDSRM